MESVYPDKIRNIDIIKNINLGFMKYMQCQEFRTQW